MDKIIEKLTSGKFLITMIVGIVFAYLSCAEVIPTDKVMEVVLIVIYAYFTKSKENK